jgi:LytS/YehU family sensor histidine kinase
MPNTAGILDILSSLYLIGLFLYWGWGVVEAWPLPVISVFAALIAFVGGIYALRRKKWPIALAGSFAAVITCFTVVMILYIAKPYYGVRTIEFVRSWAAVVAVIPAVILTMISRKQFERK